MARSRKNKLSQEELEDISSWERERVKSGTSRSIKEKIEIKCKSEAQKKVIEAMKEKILNTKFNTKQFKIKIGNNM